MRRMSATFKLKQACDLRVSHLQCAAVSVICSDSHQAHGLWKCQQHTPDFSKFLELNIFDAASASKTLITEETQPDKEYFSALDVLNNLAAVVQCTLNDRLLSSLVSKTLFPVQKEK